MSGLQAFLGLLALNWRRAFLERSEKVFMNLSFQIPHLRIYMIFSD